MLQEQLSSQTPEPVDVPQSRRSFLGESIGKATALAALPALSGCIGSAVQPGAPTSIWGRKGLGDGRLMKPRAITASPDDELYLVDMTGRIQVFDASGEFQRGWRTPLIKQGKPTGLAFSSDGNLMVADTHYFRVLFYAPDGTLDEERTIGGTHGDSPGEFHFVTDVAEAPNGHFFVGQYGQIDHIQEFSPSGEYIRTFGSQGSEPYQFSRPQSLMFDDEGLLWVADACNHRMQVFDITAEGEPKLVSLWGTIGTGAGQIKYPYGIVFDKDGSVLISEYGNHRVQRFDRSGKSLQLWGGPGTDDGQFNSPWALEIDSKQRLFVLDSLNHRVQMFDLS